MKQVKSAVASVGTNTRAGFRSTDGWVYVLILAAICLRAAFLVWAPTESLLYRISDDAFYYFKTAQHIVAGRGVTFDGLNLTNGFHPLWMCTLLPIFALTRDHPDTSLRLVCALQAVFAGGTFMLAWAYAKRMGGLAAAVITTALMLQPFLLNHLLNGLETGLLVFLLFSSLWVTERYDLLCHLAPWRPKGVLGALLALVFLCRLDTVFVLLSLAGLVWLFSTDRPASLSALRQLIRWHWPTLVIFALLVAPYFAWNILSFGHWTPISGALKSSFPWPVVRITRLLTPHWLPYTAALATTALWVFWAGARRSGYLWSVAIPAWRARRRVPLLAVLWCAALLHYLFAALFLQWAAYWWHFASHVPVIAVLGGLAGAALVKSHVRPRLALATVVALCLCAAGGTMAFDRLERGVHHRPWYDAALWAKQNTPPNSVFAMTDCGLFGYFSQRRTINLDGVINSYEYQRALSEGWLPQFFVKCGVTHVADYEVPMTSRRSYRIDLPARLTGDGGYELLVEPDTEVYASAPYRQHQVTRPGKAPIRFLIWRIDQTRVVKR